jgi:hypothetical protein
MRLIKQYQRFFEMMNFDQEEESVDKKEIKEPKYNVKNLVSELCICMVLINNEFLDNILDRGLKARYLENTQVFLTDLKGLILAKNRLHLGEFDGEKFLPDHETSKINNIFESVEFDIEKNWDVLVNARICARNIIDKTLSDEKLTEDLISAIYWIGPNKSKKQSEEFVIELNDGRQIGYFLNKSLNTTSSTSFVKFAEVLIGNGVDDLYDDEMMRKWDKLIQTWIKTIYKSCNKNIKVHIEKFIDPLRIDSIGFFEYFNIRHKDPRFKVLGELIPEFEKNILKFSDLLENVWKNKESSFSDPESVEKDWSEKKIFILNSKILEHILTKSIIKIYKQDTEKLEDGWKLAKGKLKMKFMKLIVDKIGSSERDIFGLSKNGNIFHKIPQRKFFRSFYDQFDIKFDYHVRMMERTEEDTFNFKIKLLLDKKELMDIVAKIKPSGQMGNNLSVKILFEPIDTFNLVIYEKQLNNLDEAPKEI